MSNDDGDIEDIEGEEEPEVQRRIGPKRLMMSWIKLKPYISHTH